MPLWKLFYCWTRECRGALLSIFPCRALSVCTQLQPLLEIIAAECDCSTECRWQTMRPTDLTSLRRSSKKVPISLSRCLAPYTTLGCPQTRNSWQSKTAFPWEGKGCTAISTDPYGGWLPAITSLASSIPEGVFPNLRPSLSGNISGLLPPFHAKHEKRE